MGNMVNYSPTFPEKAWKLVKNVILNNLFPLPECCYKIYFSDFKIFKYLPYCILKLQKNAKSEIYTHLQVAVSHI